MIGSHILDDTNPGTVMDDIRAAVSVYAQPLIDAVNFVWCSPAPSGQLGSPIVLARCQEKQTVGAQRRLTVRTGRWLGGENQRPFAMTRTLAGIGTTASCESCSSVPKRTEFPHPVRLRRATLRYGFGGQALATGRWPSLHGDSQRERHGHVRLPFVR